MRRLVIYFFYDPQGQVDDFILYKLRGLRSHAEHLLVVSNGDLDPEARQRLESVADQVWNRPNLGFDVWAYKEALTLVGRERLAEFDELVLMNYTFFGPVGSFAPLFAAAEARDHIDFWGISNHAEVVPHPFADAERMEAHIQSHWIAVRRSMFLSAAWDEYWTQMPMIEGYFDSVTRHEGRFTTHFEQAGFRSWVAYDAADYPSQHPIMDNTALLLADGCPIVKRRTFFHDPIYLEQHAIDGRDLLRTVAASGYPVDLMLANLARTSAPRALATNLGLLEILPDVDLGFEPEHAPRVVAACHVFYPEMTDELVDRLDLLPGSYDLVITTPDTAKAAQIEQVLADRGRSGDVRVVESNRGRDISAFFIGCRDLIDGDGYDLIVKLHSKKSPQDDVNLATMFKRHLYENLLWTTAYAGNVLRLFQQHPSLGMVFPPVIHIGYPTLGHAWFTNRDRAEAESDRLGLTVPFDEHTPLAAYGSMFLARPAALRRVTAADYSYDEFPAEGDYADGALSHTLERLMSYAVLSSGYHVREVMNPDLAAVNYSFLEYKHQAIGALLPADPYQQPAYLAGLRAEGVASERSRARRAARRSGPRRDPARASPGRSAAPRAQAAESAPMLRQALALPYRKAREVYRGARSWTRP